MAEIKRYYFQVEVELEVTREEVEHFRTLSASHYDGKCRSASAPGGFLFGWRNHFDWWEKAPIVSGGPTVIEKTPTTEDLAETASVLVTWHQMDTLCKILEGEQFQSQKPLRMYGVIRKFLLDMRKESEKVNGQYAEADDN